MPGCVSQGRDEKEALDNIREALTAWIWAEDHNTAHSFPSEITPLLIAV
ncbi:MAG: type II toxin-antitoxin system HicB family antitoxin [Acidobacteriaceae bacterium]